MDAKNKRIGRQALAAFGLIVVSGLLVGFTGCSTPKGFVAKEWSDMLREMQVTAVFPPREDMQPGDIYSDPYPTRAAEDEAWSEDRPLAISALLASVNVSAQIKSYYSKRYQFPPTPTEYSAEKIGQPGAPNDSSVFDMMRKGYLPLVGFPEYSYTDVTEGDLSALVPIHGLSVALGSTWSDYKSVSLKLRASESYGLPRNLIQNAFFKAAKENGDFDSVWSRGTSVRLIQEVYLTRDIEITANASKSFSAAGGVKPGTASMDAGWGAMSLTDMAKQIKAFNTALKSQSDPGGYFEVTSISQHSITMKRVYYRPIAVGFKFVRLYKGQDGQITTLPTTGDVAAIPCDGDGPTRGPAGVVKGKEPGDINPAGPVAVPQ